jgi:glyoxylase I family protein
MTARLTGRLIPILTVRDLDASARWYGTLLDADQRRDHDDAGVLTQVVLTEPGSGVQVCLVRHPGGGGEPFDETRCGLDHLEFLVPDGSALDAWAARLDALGIAHSGVKRPAYTANAMLTFRDPDGIQLEFFWPAPR